MRIGISGILLAGALVFASFGAARTAEPFKLTSPSYADNAPLAKKSAGNREGNPNCVGQSISPPLKWANPPEGTKSYALVLFDPDAPSGRGFVHMVIYGIPVTVTGFAEGELSKPSDKFVGGKNGIGLPVYSGPCPPPGDWHHYVFTLIATDLDPKAIPAGMTRDELFAAITGHAKNATGLVLRFRHPS